MTAFNKLYRLALIVFFGVLNVFAETNVVSSRPASEKLKLVLLSHAGAWGETPLEEKIREFQRVEGCSTSTVVSLMAAWATNNWNSKDRAEKRLARMSISSLARLPSLQAHNAFVYLSGCDGYSYGNLSVAALVRWRFDFNSDDVFRSVIGDQSQYRLTQRLAIYDGYMEDASHLPIGSERQQQAISNLQYCFNIDSNDSTRLSLDRVLYSRCPAHSNSVSRIKWLEQMNESSVGEWREYARQMMFTNVISH